MIASEQSVVVFQRRVLEQIELLNAGDPLGALDEYLADDCVMYDNDEVFAFGKPEARAKQEPFISAAREIEGRRRISIGR